MAFSIVLQNLSFTILYDLYLLAIKLVWSGFNNFITIFNFPTKHSSQNSMWQNKLCRLFIFLPVWKHYLHFSYSETFQWDHKCNFKWQASICHVSNSQPLWAVINLNSNWICPVCTGLPDNSVYWQDPMVASSQHECSFSVQYVALTRLTYDRGQFSWHSPVKGLTMATPMARSDYLQYPAYLTDPLA